MLIQFPAMLAAGETLDALAVLAIAIGLAGVAILILFSRKKI